MWWLVSWRRCCALPGSVSAGHFIRELDCFVKCVGGVVAALRSNPLKNIEVTLFIFTDDKYFRELWLPAAETLFTLTSKELESLNLNKIIRLCLNSRISPEFDLLVNYERVYKRIYNIVTSPDTRESKCNNCQLVILTCSWQVWILKTHINQILTNIARLTGLSSARSTALRADGNKVRDINNIFLKSFRKFTINCNILLINENC